MYSVGEMLNAAISESSISKNTIIQSLDIDRSSFYQILKGKRLPTSEQLIAILNSLTVSSLEKKQISEVYISEKLGALEYSNRKAIINLIDALRESIVSRKYSETTEEMSSGIISETTGYTDTDRSFNTDIFENTTVIYNRSEIKNLLRILFKSAVSDASKADIKLHIPIYYLEHIGFFDVINSISGYSGFSGLSFEHIICYQSRKNIFADDLINDFTKYISFLISLDAVFNTYYYYDANESADLSAVLFPYYILLPDGLLLLNSSCDKAMYIKDKDIVTVYNSEFNDLRSKLSSILSNTDEVEKSHIPYLMSLSDETKTYYMTYRPGISYLANDTLIESFVPKELQEMYKLHVKGFQHTRFCELISPEGLKDLFNNGVLSELDTDITLRNEDDYLYIRNALISRLGKTLYIIDSNFLPISDNWSIYCIEHELVIFVPLQRGKRYFSVSEKNIVEAFTQFFENITEDVILMSERDALQLLSGNN